jgi:predicted dienelactone hydrolase
MKPQDFLVRDEARQREIPICVYLSAEQNPPPVLLFNHGGSRTGSSFLGQYCAARGYLVVYLEHPGSDTRVWQDQPPEKRLTTMQHAASVQNFLLRIKDVPAVLDQLTAGNKTNGHPLAGRLDLYRVGMSGHSFGDVTTQAVSGQHSPLDNHTDPRNKAAIALSVSTPRIGNAKAAFAAVKSLGC